MAISVVLIALLAMALGRGFTLGGDGTITVLGSTEPVNTEQVEARQPQLEAAATNAIDDLSVDQNATTAARDISGDWVGADGFSYRFSQVGSAVAFQEFAPGGLLTSVGEGVVTGDAFEFQVTNGFTSSWGSLWMTPNGLEGQVYDSFGNVSNQLLLTR